jgi:hypothetical protein
MTGGDAGVRLVRNRFATLLCELVLDGPVSRPKRDRHQPAAPRRAADRKLRAERGRSGGVSGPRSGEALVASPTGRAR